MIDIVGYENQYAITEDGQVWSYKRKRFLSLWNTKKGYIKIGLRDSNDKQNRKVLSVHRLVAQAYIDNPEDKLEVNHINSKRDDNRLENLEWVTRSENNQHAWTFGNKFFKLTKNHISKIRKKLTIDEESEMCEAYATGLFSQDELGKGFGISQSIVCRITQGVS